MRQTETLTQRSQQPAPAVAPRPSADREIVALERDLSARLGLAVNVSTDGTRGTLRIQFRDYDQLDGLITLLMR